MKIIATIDPDPQKAVSPDLSSAIKPGDADVAVISTVSTLEKMEAQIKDAADLGMHVVSTCEEMSHPLHTKYECAFRLPHNARCPRTCLVF